MRIYTTSHARLVKPEDEGEELIIIMFLPGVQAFRRRDDAEALVVEAAAETMDELDEKKIRHGSPTWHRAEGGRRLDLLIYEEDQVFVFSWAITETELAD